MSKFNVGDKVTVRAKTSIPSHRYDGQVATVTQDYGVLSGDLSDRGSVYDIDLEVPAIHGIYEDELEAVA